MSTIYSSELINFDLQIHNFLTTKIVDSRAQNDNLQSTFVVAPPPLPFYCISLS